MWQSPIQFLHVGTWQNMRVTHHLKGNVFSGSLKKCQQVPLGDLDLNILKSVSRHLYKHTGTKISW